jgi:hypothetical protein
VLANNYNNYLLIPNLSKIRNNFRLTDRTKEIDISAAELILEEDHIIIVLDPVFYIISYLIVRRNIMFIVNQAVSVTNRRSL